MTFSIWKYWQYLWETSIANIDVGGKTQWLGFPEQPKRALSSWAVSVGVG